MAITWLADVLRNAGLTVVEEGNWQTRAVSGPFDPIGVLWHHTAGVNSSSSRPAPSLSTVINGRPELTGPLCHALVDFNGVFHLISANRANHAGAARASGPIPAGDGNTMLIGWEIDYSGDQPSTSGIPDQAMSTAQYNASVIATAAVLRTLGRDASYARGHVETSTKGKVDPSYINLDQMRADVARHLNRRGGAVSDWSGDGHADVIGVDEVGRLRYYPNNGLQLGAWQQIGDGFGTFKHVMAADWSADGFADILGVDDAGRLRYYPHNGNGLGAWQQIGDGWLDFPFVHACDFSGDGYADVIGVDSLGDMYYYPHSGNVLGPRIKIGAGWSNFKHIC
jgi:hypothetical protein